MQRQRLKLMALVMALVIAVAGSTPQAWANKGDGGRSVPQASSDVLPGGPLTVEVFSNTQVGLLYNGAQQFFARTASGIYLTVNGQNYGPTVPAGGSANAIPYTEISQTLAGNTVTTVVAAGNTGLRMTVKTSYTNGARDYRSDITVQNTGAAAVSYRLSHAADLFPGLQGQNSDNGIGYFNAASGAVGAITEDRTFFQLFVPLTPASAYQEAFYDTLWGAVGNFNNTINTSLVDAGAGLQWNRTLSAGASDTVSDLLSFDNVDPTLAPILKRPPADVWAGVKASPNLNVQKNAIVSFTVKAKNWGKGPAEALNIFLPYDNKTLKVLDTKFDRDDLFVVALLPGVVVLKGGSLIPDAEVTGVVRFQAIGAEGAVAAMQPVVTWEDDHGSNDDAHTHFGNVVLPVVGSSNRSGETPARVDLAAGKAIVRGQYFAPDELVDTWFDLGNGQSEAFARFTATGDGTVKSILTVRNVLPAGTYRLVMRGVYSGGEQVATIVVR